MRLLKTLIPAVIVLSSSGYSAGGDTPRAFDFGSSTPFSGISRVERGYTAVTGKELYSSTRGYGWDTAVAPIDLGLDPYNFYTADPLLRDINYALEAQTFRIDLPNGRYVVGILTGAFNERALTVSAEGLKQFSVETPAEKYIAKKFEVTVSDGQLNVEFSRGPGKKSTWVINGMIVKEVKAGETGADEPLWKYDKARGEDTGEKT